MPLIPTDLLRKLSALTLSIGKRGSGMAGGERRSARRGQSQEFADHRPYVPGDDLRHLDWHLYGRLDTLWLKLFEENDDRVVQTLLDCSASMQGEKLDYARQLAAGLAFVALGHGDRVTVAGISDTLAHYAPARRGRSAAAGVFRSLEEVHPSGGSELAKGIARSPRQRGNGVSLLFTDMLYPEGPDAALKQLQARGSSVHAFHLVSPADLRPDLSGDVVLVDAETGEEMSITVDDDVLDTYESTMLAWADEMRATCMRSGVGYTRLITSMPVEDVLLRELRKQGLLS